MSTWSSLATMTTNEQLSLFEEPSLPTPNGCSFEAYLLELGEGMKSKCIFRGSEVWTNCREVGHCIWSGWHEHDTLRKETH